MIEHLHGDCLNLIFDQLIPNLRDILAIALVSRSFLAVARGNHVSTAVFNRIVEQKDVLSCLKCMSFYENASPFDTLLWQFPVHEIRHQLAFFQGPLKAKCILAADLLRRYPTLWSYDKTAIKDVLQYKRILPGEYDGFVKLLRSPARYTKILLLDTSMRQRLFKALGFGVLVDIYWPWMCTFMMLFIAAVIVTRSLIDFISHI